jgi:hypothetical protein
LLNEEKQMSASFDLFVSYSQIAVFNPNLQNPFNDWQPQHIAQGFSWRPGSVSFGTLEDSGVIHIEIVQAQNISLDNDSKIAILVPFSVSENNSVEISSIGSGQTVEIPNGNYALVFEIGYSANAEMWCRFTFVPKADVQADILIADSSLSPSSPLLMDARPA